MSRRKDYSKTSHMIWNLDTGNMECLNCGSKQAVAYPIGLSIFVAMIKAFEKIHRHCTKPKIS